MFEDPERPIVAEDGDAAYRPVSTSAILAFIVGLASAVALVHPLGLFFPAAGIALSAWAFYTIEHADPRPTGRRWAAIGLCVSLFFGAAGPVRFAARRHALQERARAFCDQWLAAFQQNQPWLAFELTRPGRARPALDTPLDELSKSEGFNMGYQKFLENPVVKLLAASHGDFTVRYVRELRFESNDHGDYFDEIYEATFAGGESSKVPIHFNLERTLSEPDRREQWKLTGVGRLQPGEAD